MRAWWLVAVLGLACGRSSTSTPSAGTGSAPSAPSAAPEAARPHEDAAVPGTLIRWAPLAEPFHAVAVHAGDDRRCAISDRGEVACWGGGNVWSDDVAELKADRATPRRIVGVTDAIDVAMIAGWICVAQAKGSGGCFRAEPGADKRAPAEWTVPPVELGVSDRQLCARLRDGTVDCHGSYGGYDTSSIAGATSLSCNIGCCAVTKDGLVCFGTNTDIGEATKATVMPDHGNAVKVALGGQYACVKTKAGGASCWGVGRDRITEAAVRDVIAFDMSACALRSDGTLACTSNVPPLRDVVAGGGSCAVHGDGSIECWGLGYNGEHGDGKPVLVLTPTRIASVDHVVDARIGDSRACTLRDDQSLVCWGALPESVPARAAAFANDLYEPTCTLASETEAACNAGEFTKTPVTLDGGTIGSLAVGYHGRMCRVDKAGALSWAYHTGVGWSPIKSPAPVAEVMPTLSGFYVRLADGHVAALPPGKLDETTMSYDMTTKLVPVAGVSDAVQIATADDGACARTKAGQVWCWQEPARKPAELESLRGASWIAGRGGNYCAVLNGEIWCWGDTESGQLGNGTIPPRIPDTVVTERAATPVRAKTTFVATRVVVGGSAACAVDDKAQLWCWGSNRNGQLGFGRAYERKTPVRVVGIGPR